MRGAPRGESASRSEPRSTRVQRSRALSRSGRLRTPEQFAALAGEGVHWRAARQWISAAARVEPHPEPVEASVHSKAQSEAQRLRGSVHQIPSGDPLWPVARAVRFGFTVGRRQARRAVQRVMVKRVLRESARHAAESLRQVARGRQIDVVLRLRSPLPDPSQMGLPQLKRSLRAEADSLIEQLARHLAGAPTAARRGAVR